MDRTSATLLEQVRNPGDGEAWRRFVQLYTPLLYHWGRRMGLQDSDAADLLQDVFAILHQKLPTFRYDQGKSFRAWLHTITWNKWREKRRHEAVLSETTNQDGLADRAEPDRTDPFWEMEYRQQLVRRALQMMRAEFQPATWKACWEQVTSGRPAAEVAAGSWDGIVYLWDVATGRKVRTVPGHLNEVRAVAISPDGRTLSARDQSPSGEAVYTGFRIVLGPVLRRN